MYFHIVLNGNLIRKQAPLKSNLSLFVDSIEPLNDFIISLDIDSPKPECSSLNLSLSL